MRLRDKGLLSFIDPPFTKSSGEGRGSTSFALRPPLRTWRKGKDNGLTGEKGFGASMNGADHGAKRPIQAGTSREGQAERPRMSAILSIPGPESPLLGHPGAISGP